jgi:DNA-binding transcriptional regulator YdaS (Cro superfamily)
MAPGRGALKRAIKASGGVTVFAKRLGNSRELVYQWLRSGGVPLSRIRDVVKASNGAVTARELRPDVAELLR